MALSYDVARFRISPGALLQVESPAGSGQYWRIHATAQAEGTLTLQRGSGKVYGDNWLDREVDEVTRKAWA